MTSPPRGGDGPGAQAVVRTPVGRDASLVCKFLQAEGFACRECRSMCELTHLVARGAGPVVVAAEALAHQETEDLIRELEAQPDWSDVPLIVFESTLGPNSRVSALARQRNATVLRRPVDVQTFLGVMRAAMESRRRQIQVRELLGHQERLHRRAARRARQLQQLTMKVARAEQDERARIARVLHDELQQLLVAARMRLSSLGNQESARADETWMQETRASVDELLQEAIRAARRLTLDLNPPILQHGDLGAALEWLARETGRRHGLQVVVQSDPHATEVAPPIREFLYEAARELLFNVVKHAGVKDGVTVRLLAQKNRVILLVEDKGAGFDPAILQNCGQDPRGYGLLSIRERAELLGGHLHIESEAGQGCTSKICLPRSPEKERRPASGPEGRISDQGEHEEQAVETPPIRVLVVDDHRVVRRGIVSMLSQEEDIGVVGQAASGEEAIARFRELRPDVVLMDVSMPGMNGIEATQKIVAEFPGAIVFGLSMFEMDEIAERMLDAGARGYLVKSGSVQRLLEQVRTHGRTSRPGVPFRREEH